MTAPGPRRAFLGIHPSWGDVTGPRRAFLGIGSNLGDRWGYLAGAVAALPDVVAVSPVYQTEPVGGPEGQGAFLNAVVELRTLLSPHRLLDAAHAAEAAARRVRRERWGPRTLDVDVLLVGDLVVDDPELTVPHPRMWERGFVLVPLADLAPELVGDRLRPGLADGVRRAGTLRTDGIQRAAGKGADRPARAAAAMSATTPTGGGSVAPSPPGTASPPGLALSDPAELARHLDDARRGGRQVGLVPTMGALHGGHLSLIRRARADCDTVVVSVFVNPLQFAPTDDLSAYPRDLDDDCARAAEAGATVVFAPSVEQMWSDPPSTTVHVDGVSVPLEGRSRPGHFDGVATIVAKLFALTGPCWAYFGEKDFQQLAVVRRMAADLSLPVEVVGCPTVREPDGLALSSRNAYLTAAERQLAPRLYWALLAGRRAIEDDALTDPPAVVAAMRAALAAETAFDLDYAAVVDPVDLETPRCLAGEVRLLIAARLGRARLIDNLPATVPDRPVRRPPTAAS